MARGTPRFGMRSIRARLVLLVATAAIAPLVAYGFVSIQLLRTSTAQSVASDARAVATRAAEQIDRYVAHNLDLIEAVAANLRYTSLERWQQERILRNYVLKFPEVSELTLFDPSGRPLVSSRLTRPRLRLTQPPPATGARPLIAPVQVDEAQLPFTEVTLRLDESGRGVSFLVGALRLEELWHLVDRVRVGERGHALLVDETGRLLAHGNPDDKPRVARGEHLTSHPLIAQAGAEPTGPRLAEYPSSSGQTLVGVVQPIASLGWKVVIEQPRADAFALATRLERFLVFTIGLALLATITIALLWGRSFLRPIDDLIGGTRALAEGRLEARVPVSGRDEFAELGEAFNNMADRLVTLQEEAVSKERQAVFGRIAAGLVHDIAHPIQNIGNNCRLMLKMYDDAEYRESFRRLVDREFGALKRLLEDLRNLARPIPLERFPVDVNRSLTEAAERMALVAEQAGVTLELALSDRAVYVEGDLFALGRVYRNLLLNAVQATPPGGIVRLSSRAENGHASIEVMDTGCGIAPQRLPQIFDDFATTKRRGLGLGLAISKRIVAQLGGAIRVQSEVGRGTTFTLEFPALPADQIPLPADHAVQG
jgi:signal transduction histidine kinase